MTKFELPEKPKKTNTSEDFNNLRKAVDELDKFDYTWKTYANKADRRINAANKYIEELERENQRLVSENMAVKTLVDSAKPQQALPVVPECADIWIKKCQELNWLITDALAPECWESDFAKDTEKWLKKSKENFNLLALAFITGKYEVEKPQLFYLKHIDMSETNEHYDYYSTKNQDGSLNHVGIEKRWTPKTLDYTCKFTQQEIDSMQTGSYEQIGMEEA